MNLAINAQPTKGWYKSGKIYRWLFWFSVAVVVLIPRVLDLNQFYIRDELSVWNWSDEFTQAIWAGDLAGTLTTSDYPGIPLFWVQTAFLSFKYSFPGLFPHTLVPPDQLKDFQSLDMLAERRLAAGIFLSLQIFAVVWLVRRLFGIEAALLSAILLGLDPFSLTEARALRLEMISAGFICLSVLSYLFYLRCRRRRWLLISGVMAGLGVSSKTSAGLVVPYIWLLLLLELGLGPGQGFLQRAKRVVGHGLRWAAGAVGAFWLIWPAMWVRPLEALSYIFLMGIGQAAERSVWGDKVFFWGQVLPGDPGPFFYPVVFAFRTTPLTWIGLILAMLSLAAAIWRLAAAGAGKSGSERRVAWPVLGLALLLAYVVVVTAGLTAVISKVDRFLLIVLPVLNIVTALGIAALLHWLARLLDRRRPGSGAWLPAVAIPVVLAVQLGMTWPAHPYYFTYWNPWMGGGRAAMSAVPVGAGEGIDLAMDFLNRRPGGAESSVVCGASHPWCSRQFSGETLRSAAYFDGQWIEADYATFYISQLQRQEYPPEIVDFFFSQEPLYRVELGGVTYVWVYATPKVAYFAGRLNDLSGLARLLGYDLVPRSPAGAGVVQRAGDTIEARVWWTNWGAGVNNLVLRWVDDSGYEWGRARLAPLPEYASVPADRRAVVAGTAALPLPPGTPPGLYFLKIGVLDAAGERLAGQFRLPDGGNTLVVTPGPPLTDPAGILFTRPVHQALAPAVTLLGYDPPEQVLTAESPAWLTLYWQAEDRPADYWLNLRLVDPTGREVVCWQGQPGRGYYPTRDWRPGEIIKDVWALQVDPDTPVERYTLQLSLSRRQANEAQTAVGETRMECPLPATGDWTSLGQVEVWPQPVNYEVPPMQAELRANFGDRLTLLGYNLYVDTGGGGEAHLSPYLYWQSPAELEQAFDLRLTLRPGGSDRVEKEWVLPLGAGEPKTLWKAGEIFGAIYQLDINVARSGSYDLDIALVDRASGRVVPVKVGNEAGPPFVRIENLQNKVAVRVVEQ